MIKFGLTYLRRKYIEYAFYVLPVMIIMLVAVLTIGVVIPGFRKGWEMRQKLRAVSEREANLVHKLETLQGLDEVELNEKAIVVRQALPDNKDVGSVLLGLKRAAAIAGVSLGGVDLSPGNLEASSSGKPLGSVARGGESKDKGVMAVEVKISGEVNGVIEFLRVIQQEVLPVMRVRNLTVGHEAQVWSVSLHIEANYWPVPAKLEGVDKALVDVTYEEELSYTGLVSRLGRITLNDNSSAEIDVPLGNPQLIQHPGSSEF